MRRSIASSSGVAMVDGSGKSGRGLSRLLIRRLPLGRGAEDVLTSCGGCGFFAIRAVFLLSLLDVVEHVRLLFDVLLCDDLDVFVDFDVFAVEAADEEDPTELREDSLSRR